MHVNTLRVALVSGSAWIARGVNILIQLALMRLVLNRSGTDHFAVWSVVGGLYSWFLLIDLGLGAAVQSKISTNYLNIISRNLISYCIIRVLCYLLVGMLFFGILSPFIYGLFLGKISGVSDHERWLFFLFGGISLLVSTSGQIQQKIRYGMCDGVRANIVASIAVILGYLSALFVYGMGFGNSCLIAFLSYYLVSGSVFWLDCFFLYMSNGDKPPLTDLEVIDLRALSKKSFSSSGLGFLILQTSPLLIAMVGSASMIVEYSILMKVYGLAHFAYSAYVQAVAPEVVSVVCSGGIQVDRMKIPAVLAVFSVAIIALVFCFAPSLVFDLLLVHEKVQLSGALIIACAFYFGVRFWTDTYAVLLSAGGRFGDLHRSAVWHAILAVPLQLVLGFYGGGYGVIWGLVISYLCFPAHQLPRAWRRWVDLAYAK